MRRGLLSSTAAMLLGSLVSLTPASPLQAQVQPSRSPQGVVAVKGSSQGTVPGTESPPVVTSMYTPSESGPSGGVGFSAEQGTCAPSVAPPVAAASDFRFWLNADYLLWKLKGKLPADLAGALGGTGFDANTLTNNLQNDDFRSGFRLSLGYSSDSGYGVELSGFYLEQLGGSFHAVSTVDPSVNSGNITPRLFVTPDLSRGIVDPATPVGDLDAGDLLKSDLSGRSSSRFWGFEVNALGPKCYFGGLTFNWILAGFKQVNLDENLTLNGNFVFSEPNPDEAVPGPEDGRTAAMRTFDSVSTRNHFYGAQVGAAFDWHCYCFTIDAKAKFAVGGMSQRISLSGNTFQDTTTLEPSPGAAFVTRATGVVPGGLITPEDPPTTTKRTRISVIPELNVDVGYQITDNIRVYAGYNFMLVTNVARVGDQSSATPTSKSSDLTIHGIDFGLQFRY